MRLRIRPSSANRCLQTPAGLPGPRWRREGTAGWAVQAQEALERAQSARRWRISGAEGGSQRSLCMGINVWAGAQVRLGGHTMVGHRSGCCLGGTLGRKPAPGVAAAQWLRWRVDLPVQLGFSATSAHCRAKPLSNPAVYFSPLPRHHLLPLQGTLSLSVSRLPSTPNPQWRTIPAAGR